MLTRAEFCHLTNMDPERLKSLGRRDQLPVYENANSPVPDIEARAGRRNYRTIDALRMIVQDDFARAGGIPVEDAVKATLNAFGWGFGTAALNSSDRMNDIWIGVVRHDLEGCEISGAAHVGGTLPQVTNRISALEAEVENFRVILVNLSGAYRTLCKRASALPADVQERIVADITSAAA